MTLATLQQMSVASLARVAKAQNIQAAYDIRKPELIIQILRTWTVKSGPVFAEGVLEKLPEGYGFLRASASNFCKCLPRVSQQIIQKLILLFC